MIRHPSNCNESSAIAAAILTAVPPSAFRLPPHVVKILPRHLLERAAALADMHVALYEDAVAKRVIARARMEECIGDYGRLRLDILDFLGQDPASEDLMPLPVISQAT